MNNLRLTFRRLVRIFPIMNTMMFLLATHAASQDILDDQGLSLLQLRAMHSYDDSTVSGYPDAGEDGISQWAKDEADPVYRSLTKCPEFTPGRLCGAGNIQTMVQCGSSFCTEDICGTQGTPANGYRDVNFTTNRGINCGAPEALPWQAHAEQCIKQCGLMFPDGVVHCSLGDENPHLSTIIWGKEGSREGGACPAPGIQYNMPIVGYDVDWNTAYRSGLPANAFAHCWAKLGNPKTKGVDGVQKSFFKHPGNPAGEDQQTCMIDPLLEKEDTAAAAGDPHMESSSGEKSDLCCSGGHCEPCA